MTDLIIALAGPILAGVTAAVILARRLRWPS